MSAELDELVSGAEELGLCLEPEVVERLISFLDGVYVWNRSAGLTTIPRSEAVRLHLLDSLLPWAFFAPKSRVADLGSGGGFPGVPLAVVLPAVNFTLIESNRRRANFLAEMRRELRLENVSVVQGDVHRLDLGTFDTVISRAFREPGEFLGIAASLLGTGGTAVVMAATWLNTDRARTLESTGFELDDLAETTLPGGTERRTVARCRYRR